MRESREPIVKTSVVADRIIEAHRIAARKAANDPVTIEEADRAKVAFEWVPTFLHDRPACADALILWARCQAQSISISDTMGARMAEAVAAAEAMTKQQNDRLQIIRNDLARKATAEANARLAQVTPDASFRKKVIADARRSYRRAIDDARAWNVVIKPAHAMPGKALTESALTRYRRAACSIIANGLNASGKTVDPSAFDAARKHRASAISPSAPLSFPPGSRLSTKSALHEQRLAERAERQRKAADAKAARLAKADARKIARESRRQLAAQRAAEAASRRKARDEAVAQLLERKAERDRIAAAKAANHAACLDHPLDPRKEAERRKKARQALRRRMGDALPPGLTVKELDAMAAAETAKRKAATFAGRYDRSTVDGRRAYERDRKRRRKGNLSNS